MNVKLVSADKLTADHLSAWVEIQRSNPALDSPYFSPEFTLAAAAVRGDVEVGVLEKGGTPVGFFPFQRTRANVALPVGGKMSDFHGLAARSDCAWEPRALLRGCRLSAWHFDHLIASQEPLRPYHWHVAPSPFIDLERGWEGYRRERLAGGRKWFTRAERKVRHARREAGPLHLEPDARDPAVFQTMLKWKRLQYRRTGTTDVLAFDWTVALLERIRTVGEEDFSGVTSALYMGGVLTAVLFSMRSRGVLHAWFPAYHPDFARLSPGAVFWIELIKACPGIGVRRIDLGKGPEEYKSRLMSGAVDVAEGAVDPRPLAGPLSRKWRRAYYWSRRATLPGPLIKPGRFFRRLIDSRSFRR